MTDDEGHRPPVDYPDEDEVYVDPEPPDDWEPPAEREEDEDPNPRAMQPKPVLALLPPVPPPVIPITQLVTTECPKCKHVIKPYYRACPKCEGDRNLDKVDALARAIRELKEIALSGDPNPERERQLMKELKIHDHPDIDGLVRWCQGAREKAMTRGSVTRGKKKW